MAFMKINGRTASELAAATTAAIRAKEHGKIKSLKLMVYDIASYNLKQIEFLSKKIGFRLKVNGIDYQIINEKTGDVGKDFTKMYQKVQNTIILDDRHLSKSIYNGSVNGVIWDKTNNAIKSLLVDNFYYNDDYKEFSHTKLLVKNQYLQYVDNKNEELNPNYQYKCIDYKKRNSKEFCPRILINKECSEKEQEKIIKSLDRILDYHMKHNKIDFKITFVNSKTIYKQFKEGIVVPSTNKYPQYIVDNMLLYKFFGIEYKNFLGMEMPNIEYFLDKEYLAMPEALGVDSLEVVLEMLHQRDVTIFDEMINRVIEEKQHTIGFKEEIENDEEDLY